MSTYWPGQELSPPNMVKLCRFCGRASTVIGDTCEHNTDGHEYVEVNGHQVGPVGPGTPAARMRWLWDELRRHEAWLAAHSDYNAVRSNYTGMMEVMLVQALDRMVEGGGD